MQAAPLTDLEQIEMYVSSSIKHAFARVSGLTVLIFCIKTSISFRSSYLGILNIPEMP